MRLETLRRPAFALAFVTLAGTAGFLAYRWRAAGRPPAAAADPGIVRETEIHVAPEKGGRLASVLVAPGQKIARGDVLAVLSSPELTAALAEAKAAAANAQANRANVYAGVRKEELDIAAHNVDIAQSNLALAKQEYTRSAALAAKYYGTQQKLDEKTGALRKAEANLILQRANYARSKAGPTAEERASADAKVALAEAAAATLAAKLAKTTLRAPVDGEVRLIVARPGEIMPSMAI